MQHLNFNLEVCILSHGNWEETEKAVKSAQHFGLHVHLGVTIDANCPLSCHGMTIYKCPWNENFGATRNNLLSQLKTNNCYLLWLDSDEVILTCPQILPPLGDRAIYNVRISYEASSTSMEIARVHRKDACVYWDGVIHERLVNKTGDDMNPLTLLPGLAIIHYGYDNITRNHAKISRNDSIASKYSGNTTLHPGIATAIARERVKRGDCSAMEWLQVYKAAYLFSRDKGLSCDLCWEAASNLAYCGYTTPAEKFAERNPLNITIQLALSVAHHIRTGAVDMQRFDLIFEALNRYLWDQRYPFEKHLVGASKTELRAHILQKSSDLQQKQDTYKMSLFLQTYNNRDQVYIQTADVVIEQFEDDTLALSPANEHVVSMNQSGRVFWDLLEKGATVNDCVDLMAEALGEPSSPEIINNIEAFFKELIRSGLIEEANETKV